MENKSLNGEVAAAREDEQKLEKLIEKNKGFILYQAFKTVHHFVTTSDDEWSVALIAFSEAVNTWKEEKGPFRPFASLVIRRRLLDYLNSESRHAQEISVEPQAFSGEIDEDEDSINAQVRRSTPGFVGYADEESSPESSLAKDEIDAIQQLLREYGFSFMDLTECSPKAEKTRKKCADAVAAILKSEELISSMRRDRTLPQKQISEKSGVDRKILERHRKYIIAATEILHGDFPILASYISYIKEEYKDQVSV